MTCNIHAPFLYSTYLVPALINEVDNTLIFYTSPKYRCPNMTVPPLCGTPPIIDPASGC